MVVYGHSTVQLEKLPLYSEYLYVHCRIVFSFVMPLFFLISAALQRRKLESTSFSHRDYLKRISLLVLLPFYSLSLLFLVINLLTKFFIVSPSLSGMITSVLFQQSNSDLMPSGVLWFLFTLYCFSLITYILVRCVRLRPEYLVLLGILLRCLNGIYLNSTHYFAIDKISAWFLFYAVGYNFSRIILSRPITKWNYLLAVLLSYCVCLFVVPELSNDSTFNFILKKTIPFLGLAGISGSIFIIGLSSNILRRYSNSLFVKYLRYCGEHSILIYVFHMPTFVIFKKIISLLSVPPNYHQLLLLFIPGVVFPIIYGKILSHNLFIYQVLIGRKP